MKTSSLLSLLVLGAAMSAGAAAHATDCATDADCARGEVCSYADTATPCIPEDPTCGTATAGICTTVSISGDCTTDADCPDGLACQEIGGSACSSPACPPGEACPEPTPCEPTIYYGVGPRLTHGPHLGACVGTASRSLACCTTPHVHTHAPRSGTYGRTRKCRGSTRRVKV